VDLNLDFSNVSTSTPIVTCTIDGVLEIEDLQLVASQAELPAGDDDEQGPAATPDLKRIKEKHHSVARLIAGGMQQSLVANITGYTEAYLSTMLNSPAMQELVGFYRVRQGNAIDVVTERLRGVGLKALERLDSRLDSTGEDAMDDQALLGLAKLGLDRSGHGPSNTTLNVSETHIVDHAQIKALDLAARERSALRILPVEAVRASLPAPGPKDEAD
jgi:hypothetical protein